ncbi:MAG: holo-ACP synthase [Chlamydiia bacterium]
MSQASAKPRDRHILGPGAVCGVGIDVIEIDRIRAAWKRHGDRFLSKIFCPEELDYCLTRKDPAPHLAARWAAKEAIVKALGTGFGPDVGFQDLWIQRDPSGKPLVQVSDRFRIRYGNPNFLISLSHCTVTATAVALYLGDALGQNQ